MAYFAASCDSVKKNTDFAKSLDLDYPILSDPGRSVAKQFGVVSETRKFPQRWTFYIGKNGKILHIDKKVNARAHGDQIVARLKALGVASK